MKRNKIARQAENITHGRNPAARIIRILSVTIIVVVVASVIALWITRGHHH